MKLAFASTFLLSTMAKLASAQDKDNFFDVSIHPTCKGVDFDALTAPEKEFVADALEVSYNQIHQLWDGGDWYLFGIEPNAANPELAEGMSGDDGSGYGGGGTCGGCGNGDGCIDDTYAWGYDDAVLCSNNDLIMDVSKNTKSKVDRLWEKGFAQKLKEGPYPVFHTIGKCDISMSTQEAGAPPVEAAGGAGFEELKMASIFVKCKQGSFENLSESAASFLTETLLTAYAKSHDDDEVMFNMEWNDGISATNGMAWTAEWGCHKCDNDKAKKFALRGKDNKSWADYFVHGLQNSPFPALKSLNKCKISSMFSDKPFDGTVNAEAVAEVATEN